MADNKISVEIIRTIYEFYFLLKYKKIGPQNGFKTIA